MPPLYDLLRTGISRQLLRVMGEAVCSVSSAQMFGGGGKRLALLKPREPRSNYLGLQINGCGAGGCELFRNRTAGSSRDGMLYAFYIGFNRVFRPGGVGS